MFTCVLCACYDEVWKSEVSLKESVLSSYHLSPRTQVIRLVRRDPYLLSRSDFPWGAFYIYLIFVDPTVTEGQEKNEKDKREQG